NATGTGPAPDSLYVGATMNGTGLATPIPIVIDQASKTAIITVSPNTGLAVGDYSGTLTLLACKDPTCAAQFGGSPFQVSFTVHLLARLAASPTSLDLTTSETTTGSSTPLTITLPNGTASASVTVNYAQGQNWLAVTNQGTTISFAPNATALKS